MEGAKTVTVRLALVGMAIASAVAVFWAATALAGGSSSKPASKPAGEQPAAGYVQEQGKAGGRAADRGDCPERHRSDTMPTDL